MIFVPVAEHDRALAVGENQRAFALRCRETEPNGKKRSGRTERKRREQSVRQLDDSRSKCGGSGSGQWLATCLPLVIEGRVHRERLDRCAQVGQRVTVDLGVGGEGDGRLVGLPKKKRSMESA